MTEQDERCWTCRYLRKNDGFSGECRRYPPTLLAHAGVEVQQLYPRMDMDGWCGEWRNENRRVEVEALAKAVERINQRIGRSAR